MNKAVSIFKVNNKFVKLYVEAEKFDSGENDILYLKDKSPTMFATWERQGFTVQKFLSKEIIDKFNAGISSTIKSFVDKYVSSKEFTLEKYHTFVTDDIHYKIIEEIRAGSSGTGGIPLDTFPIPISIVENRISEICNSKVTCRKTSNGSKVDHFWIRIVSPGSNDNNPPHRDVHLERSRGAVNLYFPIAGSNENSSLPIIPESHLWSEAEIVRTFGETRVNGIKYTNPATISSVRGLEMMTPNPNVDEVLVFSPYALHGGGVNFNKDLTRVSLELRFWLNE